MCPVTLIRSQSQISTSCGHIIYVTLHKSIPESENCAKFPAVSAVGIGGGHAGLAAGCRGARRGLRRVSGRAAASRPGAGEVAGTRGGVSTVAARSCCNPRLCGCHRPVGPPQHPPPKHLRVARCAAVPAAAPPDRPGHHRPRGAGSGGAERRCEGPAAAMSDIEVVLSMPRRHPSLGPPRSHRGARQGGEELRSMPRRPPSLRPPRSNQGARQGGEELRTQGRRLLSPRRPRGPGKQHHLRLSGQRFVSFPPTTAATPPRPAGPRGLLRSRFMPLRGPGLERRPHRARSPLRCGRTCQRHSPVVRCRGQLLSLGRRLSAAAASRRSVTVLSREGCGAMSCRWVGDDTD